MEECGEKIYVFEQSFEGGSEEKQIAVVYGYIVPRMGEMLTIFNTETNEFKCYTVTQVTHGTNNETNKLVATLHVVPKL